MPAFINALSASPVRNQRGHTQFQSPTCLSSTFTPRFRAAVPSRHNARYFMSEPTPDQGESPKDPVNRELSKEVKELRSVLKKCSVYLIGPMGCGKSAVGKFLAYELGFRFLDTDVLIESVAQKTISHIFEEDGEESFRDFETSVLEQVTPFIACCVSTGGGIVLRKDNWGKLHSGIVVYLETPVHVLQDRLQNERETDKRPLLKDAESIRDRINDIMTEREHLYQQADVTIHCEAGKPVDEICKDLIRTLTNFIKANPPKLSTLYPGNIPNKK